MKVNQWLADRIMPWASRHATVWPSMSAEHGSLLAELKNEHVVVAQFRLALERIADEESDIDGARQIAGGILSRYGSR
jgi:hypothetical protein